MFLFCCFLTLLWLCSALAVTTSPSVIIVGAGSAGIAAATKLIENGITNIKILEAEDRIGGRIHSVKFGDAFVDLGAEFCHGEKGNVVYDLAKNLNILELVPNLYSIKLYYSDGSKIDPSLNAELQTLISTYEDVDSSINSTGISLGEYFLKLYNSTLLKKYENDVEKLRILKDSTDLIEHLLRQREGAFSWLDPSAQKHYTKCEGHEFLSWKGHGYRTILEILVKSYPDPAKKLHIDDKIFLNKKVSKIIWNGGRVVVKLPDDTSYVADHVIFTPSLGVLKEQESKLFTPELPEVKKAIIKTTGFDGGMKIILHFPHKWWSDNDLSFSFVWKTEDLGKIIKEFPHGPVKDGKSWISSVPILLPVANNPNVLMSWLTSSFVPEAEQIAPQTFKDGIVYILNKFLGKTHNVSAPDQIIRSSWYTNPNFRGIYSYEKVGFYKKGVSTQTILAEPLKNSSGVPVVLFAGEATHPIYYSTVHGAIETGHREAEKIISLYKKTK